MFFCKSLFCLTLAGAFSWASAAVVFTPLDDPNLGVFQPTSADPLETRIRFDFFPGSGSLALAPGSKVLAVGFLAAEGPIRIVNSLNAELVPWTSAMQAGEVIGLELEAGTGSFWSTPPSGNVEQRSFLYQISSQGGGTVVESDFQLLRAYIGLEFEIGGETHYGWLSYETSREYAGQWDLALLNGRLTGFAYETQAGVSIAAGAIPEPRLSLLLAPGMGLLCLFRRRRSGSRGGRENF